MNSSTCYNSLDVTKLQNLSSVLTTICLLIFDAVVVCGNLMVILALLITRKLWTVNGFLIGSLAVADLCVGIVVLPFSILYEVLTIWIFGSTWCQLYLFIDVWVCTASIYNLVAISFDRFVAILKPLNYRLLITKSRGAAMILLFWLLAFGISCPPLIDYFGDLGYLERQGSTTNSTAQKTIDKPCQCTPLNNQHGYVFFSATASFWFPFAIITSLYVKIYLIVRRVSRQRYTGMIRCRAKGNAAGLHTSSPNTDNHEGLRIHRGKSVALQPHPFRSSVVAKPAPGDEIDHSHKAERDIEHAEIDGISVTPSPRHYPDTMTMLPQAENNTLSAKSRKCFLKNDNHRKLSNAVNRVRNRWSTKGAKATKKRFQWELQAVKSVAIVTGCFIVCWLGFAVCYTLSAFPQCQSADGCVNKVVFSIVFWLGYANSACNPLIYAMFNNDLRRAFKKIICCCCNISKNSRDSAPTTVQRS